MREDGFWKETTGRYMLCKKGLGDGDGVREEGNWKATTGR